MDMTAGIAHSFFGQMCFNVGLKLDEMLAPQDTVAAELAVPTAHEKYIRLKLAEQVPTAHKRDQRLVRVLTARKQYMEGLLHWSGGTDCSRMGKRAAQLSLFARPEGKAVLWHLPQVHSAISILFTRPKRQM